MELVRWHTSFNQIKLIILIFSLKELWEEAAKLPLAYLLRDASTYIFSCVSIMAETQEIRDETKRICDVKPFCNVLKLIDWKDDEDNEKEINFKISSLLGKGTFSPFYFAFTCVVG